jgi:predicted secreted protein
MSEIITVSLGQEFEIVLEGVPTSGFTWQLLNDQDRASIIKELGHEWKADTSVVGGRATEHLRFRALAVGEAGLRFQYRRAWESEAREERTFTVRVVPDK